MHARGSVCSYAGELTHLLYLSGVSAALCKVCAVPEGLLCAVSDMPGSLCVVTGARTHVG